MKHLLTIFHCLLAVIVTPLGMSYAANLEGNPGQALLVGFGAIILPVLVATRVSWQAGFEAGRRSLIQGGHR